MGIPVAEHTHVHQPAAIRTIQPAPIVTKTFSASPVLAQKPVFGTEPVIGPVATEVTYKQPIYKTRTYTQTHQVAQTVAAPAVIAAAPAVGAIGYGGYALGAGNLAGAGYALGAGQLVGAAIAPAAALPVAVAEH